ncbi:hypothetical protein L2E82_33474 [Cichorium intybus]|uniref:Uncharacterized protein n=1 Tax=Cichorium intybus TaxID=13427 RepID=A0ACB9BK87_CICIN|nr:hypothetical protein L2E82_33474 [Cichorium intybus]
MLPLMLLKNSLFPDDRSTPIARRTHCRKGFVSLVFSLSIHPFCRRPSVDEEQRRGRLSSLHLSVRNP